ncbi:MAG: nucleotidyltransferase domain-containing protein [Acetobacteraceae bacterium]
MNEHIANDPVLRRFRAALAATYGDRLERAVLFGSRARGDFQPDSDYDIAVFIRNPDAWFDEVVRLAELGTDILLDTGAVISAKPFHAGAYHQSLPLMDAIRSEGLDL